MQDTWVWSLGQEDPLEKKMATHSSILVRRIPWTEEPGGLWSVGSQRVRHEWSDFTWIHVAVNSYNHKEQALPSSNLHSKGRNREQSNRDGCNSLGLLCRAECVRGAWGRGVAVTAVVAWLTAVAVEMETKGQIGDKIWNRATDLQHTVWKATLVWLPGSRPRWRFGSRSTLRSVLRMPVMEWGKQEGPVREAELCLQQRPPQWISEGGLKLGWPFWCVPNWSEDGVGIVLLKDQSLEMDCSRRVHLGQAAHFWTSWRGTRLGVVRNQLSAVRHLGPNWGIWWRITPSTREYVALAP